MAEIYVLPIFFRSSDGKWVMRDRGDQFVPKKVNKALTKEMSDQLEAIYQASKGST